MSLFLSVFILFAAPSQAIVCATPPGPPPSSARAERPTEGGLYSFDETDTVLSLDSLEGRVRVHYSIEGTNLTLLDDDDSSGYPDFPEMVAASAEEVIDFYTGLGFRAPLGEDAMGLGELGGSNAFDIYLVDFRGSADGMFGVDACDREPNVCSGYMVMENDFQGYGYLNPQAAVTTLTSHELFHAVQMAYESGSPVWYTEGTAVWAERQFDPENEDFLSFAGAYISDSGRSLDEPPSGPVPTFAYATCIFWEFLSLRLGAGVILTIQESLEWNGSLPDTLAVVLDQITALGSSIRQEWGTFVEWNLATGRHAGAMDSYPFAAEITSVAATESGFPIVDENRFYPLAASYYRIDHPGGPLYFANAEEATGLRFSLHQVQDGESDGPVLAALDTWEPGAPEARLLGKDLPAGGYWLIGTYPEDAANSLKVLFCVGTEDDLSECLSSDTGDTSDSGDTSDTEEEPTDDTASDTPKESCGCASGSSTWPGLASILGLALLTRRSRNPAIKNRVQP